MHACQAVQQLLPEGADDYEKAKTVYTYLIDNAEYVESEDDQSMAGIFWKKQAGVCRLCRGSPVSAGIFWNSLYLCRREDGRKRQRGMPGTSSLLMESIIILM